MTRVIVNPAYTVADEAAGDLALLILDTPSALPPILLPPAGLNLTEGQQVWAAGYGCARWRLRRRRPRGCMHAALRLCRPATRTAAPCPPPPYSAQGADHGTLARWFYAYAYESAACSRIWREWGKEEEDGAWNGTSATLCTGLQVEDAGVCSGDSGEALWCRGLAPCAAAAAIAPMRRATRRRRACLRVEQRWPCHSAPPPTRSPPTAPSCCRRRPAGPHGGGGQPGAGRGAVLGHRPLSLRPWQLRDQCMGIHAGSRCVGGGTGGCAAQCGAPLAVHLPPSAHLPTLPAVLHACRASRMDRIGAAPAGAHGGVTGCRHPASSLVVPQRATGGEQH